MVMEEMTMEMMMMEMMMTMMMMEMMMMMMMWTRPTTACAHQHVPRTQTRRGDRVLRCWLHRHGAPPWTGEWSPAPAVMPLTTDCAWCSTRAGGPRIAP
jgi:hypothetical protein